MTNVSGFNRPLLWNPRSGERIDIPLPEIDGGVDLWDWSPDARSILFSQLYRAEYELYRYEIESRTLTRLAHPAGTLFTGYTVGDEIFLRCMNAAQPPHVVALDAATGEQKRVILQAGEVPSAHRWQSVTFPSGGVDLQAWLALPEGDGPFPTILNVHGGLTTVQTESSNAECQAWVDHGFAWLSINYHGSSSFGKEFEQSVLGRLGSLEIDDMAAAQGWLVASGIAQPGAILVEGGSYGGFLSLQALGKRPDLWAGGIAEVAVADWALLYEDVNEVMRAFDQGLFGGTPEEKPEAYKASSPITYAEAVNAPVLVIQGNNDTRCPPRQMHAYEDTLRALGKNINVHWFDAGHGTLDVEQAIEHMELMLRFAWRVLGKSPSK